MLRHTRHALIKFLQLHVPHVLRYDADPTAEALLEPGQEFSSS